MRKYEIEKLQAEKIQEKALTALRHGWTSFMYDIMPQAFRRSFDFDFMNI